MGLRRCDYLYMTSWERQASDAERWESCYGEDYGIEVRGIRGLTYENSVSSKVYVYDGMFSKVFG